MKNHVSLLINERFCYFLLDNGQAKARMAYEIILTTALEGQHY